MSGSTAKTGVTYAGKNTWHIVKAGPLRGPNVCLSHVFLCGRWAASGKLNVAQMAPTGRAEICVTCERLSDRHEDEATHIPRTMCQVSNS